MKQNISLLLLISCLSLSLQTPLSATPEAPRAGQDLRAARAQQQAEKAEFIKNLQNSPYAEAAKAHLANAKQAKRTVRSDCDDCGESFVITNADLPKVITESGVYIVECDLQYTVNNPFEPAIQILTDNVTIDFNGHTLSQVPCLPEETHGIYGYGVVIGEGYFFNDINAVFHNITLQNGTIRDFSAAGVLAYNNSFNDPNLGAKLAFENLHFVDLNILHNGTDSAYYDRVQGLQLGSFANGATLGNVHPEIAFQNVVLERVHVNENFNALRTAQGIEIVTADNVMVRDSQCNNTTGFGAFGLDIIGNNVQVINSQVNRTGTNLVLPCIFVVAGGFFQGTNIFVKDSQFNDSHTECCALTGCGFIGSNILVEDSQFNNCHAGPVFGLVRGGGVQSVGLAPLTDTLNSGFKFVRCQMNGNSIDAENPAEDFMPVINAGDVTDVEFVDCQIANHTTDAANIKISAALLGNVGNASFTGCTISNIRGHLNATGILSFTFPNPFGATANLVVQDCIIEQIHSSTAKEPVAGIAVTSLAPLNFYAAGNRISDVYADASNPFAAGIVLVGATGPVLKENSISDCQRGILLTDGDISGLPTNSSFYVYREGALFVLEFGWQVDPATYPANNPITNDQLFTNIDRGNQTVSMAPNEIIRSLMFPDEDISTWQSGDELVYHVPTGGIPVQLLDTFNGLNQVPYSGSLEPAACFPDGSTAQNLGNGVVEGINTRWTPDMIGGTIQIGDAAPVLITGFFAENRLEVAASAATDLGNFTVIYPNNGQLVDGEHLFALVIPAEPLNPGFTAEALILDNDVTRCGVGIQDDRDRTASLFLENIAFCNGVNYDVNWCGCPPVARGNLCRYPKPKNASVNLAVSCKNCD